jgi:hypothetical protein
LNVASSLQSTGATLAFKLFKLTLAGAAAGVVAISGLSGLNIYTYQRFTNETPVALLSFRQLADGQYEAKFEPVGQPSSRYLLRGDEWQMDVRMIKWTDWLTFLGEDPLFRFDRLSGRYSDVGDALQKPPTMHALGDDSGLDLWAFARDSGDWLPGIDAVYGSSVFLPMQDGLSYEVTMSVTGLLARPVSEDSE